jgi:hypothetical protein
VLALGLLALLTAAPAIPQHSSDLSRALFAEGRLWLMSDTGELSSVAEGSPERPFEDLPEPARDLCLRGQHPGVLTSAEKEPSRWTLRERRDGQWMPTITVPIKGEKLIAADCRPDGLTLLTSARLIEVTGRKQFQNIGGVGVSFAVPGMVLVLTTVNQRRSMSGNTPILVPR